MSPTLLLIIFLLQSLPQIKSSCLNESPPPAPKYYLVEKCYRSTMVAVYKSNYSTLSSCQKLGIEKKGLAINFSPPEAIEELKKTRKRVSHSCEILKCAESDGGSSLVNDTRYDYYSIYAKIIPELNSTCVPGIGMMSLQPKMNYTEAEAKCRNSSGLLADVMSEARTDALAQLLAGATQEMAYVGVRSDNGSEFMALNGDTFDCTTYRAWAPGHPKRKRHIYGCMAVTRSKMWKTISCKMKLPSICELLPSGPYRRRGTIFKSRITNGTTVTPESPTTESTRREKAIH